MLRHLVRVPKLWTAIGERALSSFADHNPCVVVQVMDENDDEVPAHVPFHEALRILPPKCSVGGMDPRLTEGTGDVDTGGALYEDEDDPALIVRRDGRPVSNTVSFAVVSDETVSHAIGRDLPCIEKRLELYVSEEDGKVYSRQVQHEGTCRIELTEPPAGSRAPVLAIEAGCNGGKSYAVHHELIRRKLLDGYGEYGRGKLPMLHFSVRITHADDLYLTCVKHYVDDSGQPIEGMNLVCYREGDGSKGERCRGTNQLVISPQSAAQYGLLGNDQQLERFRNGVLVLDEAMSFALSLGGDPTDLTIKAHEYLASLMKKLAGLVSHVIVMDRDLTLTPLVSNMLAVIAPDRDIVHVQFERPAQSNAYCYTFNDPELNRSGRGLRLACDRLELQMLQSIRSFILNPDTPTSSFPVSESPDTKLLEGEEILHDGGRITIVKVEREADQSFGYQVMTTHIVVTADDRSILDTLSTRLLAASEQTPIVLDVEDVIQLHAIGPGTPVSPAWDYDENPEGPKERRRLWIATANKGWGEKDLLSLCKSVGATYRFYHAGIGSKSTEGTSAKEDVKDTSAAWRNVHVIISTTTIEVAINVELPFLSRWLFATHHSGSLASELMQLVCRLPRGEDPDKRNARLKDHRIFTLFGTSSGHTIHTPRPEDLEEQVDDEDKIHASTKAFEIKGKKAHDEQSRAKRAKLEERGEASAPPSTPIDGPLNALRASVHHYRRLNDGAKHAVRFFEIAAKCGDARPTSLSRLTISLESLQQSLQQKADDAPLVPVVSAMRQIADGLDNDNFSAMDDLNIEDLISHWTHEPSMESFTETAVAKVIRLLERHEEMQPLTEEEKAELDASREARALRDQTRENDARALLNDVEREKEAVDTPKNASKRYELVVNYQNALAQQMVDNEEADDEATALNLMRSDFWKMCAAMLDPATGTRPQDRSAFQMLQLDIYFNLEIFHFGDDERVDAFEYIAQVGNPGQRYASISELKTGAVRLARLRMLSLQTLRTATQLRIEDKGAHVESIDLESLRAKNVHLLFSLLDVPHHREMEPLTWLKDKVDLWPDGQSQCCHAHNRLIRNNMGGRNEPEKLVYPEGESDYEDGDKEKRKRLITLAHNIAGTPPITTGKKGISITQAIKHALKAIGLHVDWQHPSNKHRVGSRDYVKGCVVREASLSGKHAVGFSLADAVEIRVKGRVSVRAADFPLAFEGDEFERAAAVSDEEGDESAPSAPPQRLFGHELEETFDPDAPRREGFNATALAAALAELQSDSADRTSALARINQQLLLDEQDGRVELLSDRLILQKSLDLEDQLRALDTALSPADAFGRRWLSVRYEPSQLGRRRPIIDEDGAIEMRTLDDNEDPLAPNRRLRPVGYSGLSSELRGMLGGSLQCGVPRLSELQVPWSVLVLDVADRLGVQLTDDNDDSMSMLRSLVDDGDSIANGVRTYYFGHAANPEADHVAAAFELIEACVHGGITHATWLERHGLADNTQRSPFVVSLQRDVRQVRDAVFESDAYGDVIRRLSRTLTHLDDGDRRRTLWIRWLQQREDTVLGDIEAELHRVRRTSDMPWFDFKLERECDDSGVPLLERLAPYRPLYPVAFVRGSLLVEDARCDAEQPATPDHVRQARAAQAAQAAQQNYHLMGQASTPSPTGSVRSSQSGNEIDTPRSERQQAKENMYYETFERKVVLATRSPLEYYCPDRWGRLELVATPLAPQTPASLPTLVRARAVVVQSRSIGGAIRQ